MDGYLRFRLVDERSQLYPRLRVVVDFVEYQVLALPEEQVLRRRPAEPCHENNEGLQGTLPVHRQDLDWAPDLLCLETLSLYVSCSVSHSDKVGFTQIHRTVRNKTIVKFLRRPERVAWTVDHLQLQYCEFVVYLSKS